VTEPFAPLAGSEEAQRALSELGYTGTAPVETDWQWTCPRHLEQRWDERQPCPNCGSPPLLIAR
jgi:hypothetical protein